MNVHQAETAVRELYISWAGKPPVQMTPLAAAGSPRKYFRIDGPDVAVVGAFNPDLKENEAFLTLTRHFHGMGLPVPELLASDRPKGTCLLADLGNTSLFDLVVSRDDMTVVGEDLYALLAQTIRMLPHFQVEGARGLDFSICYPRSVFDEQSMMWDLNYFKYYILKTSGIHFDEQGLEDDFRRFASTLMQAGQDYFMYRDFQSRNVMIDGGKPWFIDYQGGRKGPLQYDLASFLYQVKAFYPEGIREKLIGEYLDELALLSPVDHENFMEYFYPFVYLRLFQVLGAYGFRGLFEKRPHFAGSLDPAMSSLSALLDIHPPGPELKALGPVLHQLTTESRFAPAVKKGSDLTVTISSFSYKNGLPDDDSGHGGGFVFDCRALPNPGRLEEYREFTGRDEPVIEYLGRYAEVDQFLHNVFEICDRSVEQYISRDFGHLSISFGCTGGQHRSVYCAERMAEHLSQKYVINVMIRHREQNITEKIRSRHE